jgi:PAS domain S-box-containing protein
MRLISTLAEIEKLIDSFANLDSFEVLIDTIKTQIELVAEIDTTGLYLYSEEENKLKLFYAKGFSKVEQANAELTAMQRHPGYVFRTGEILWVDDQDAQQNPISIDSVRKTHTRSRMYVPVKSNNKIIGAFGIQSERPNAFTEKHLAVLKVFASLAGNAYLAIKKNNLIKKQNEENRKLSYLATHTPNNVIYADKDGKITWVNEHFESFTGYNLHEIIGKTPGSFLTGPETEPEKTSQLRNAIQTQTPIELTIANYKKNGELYYIAVQLNPVFDENREFLYFISIQQDVTQLVNKRSIILENQNQLQLNMQTIKESQARYSNLLQMTNDLITSLDGQGTILYANKSWLNKLNYTLKEVLGTNIFSYVHPDSQEHCMAFFSELNNTQLNTLNVSYSLIRKDGNKIDIEGNVVCNFENSKLIELNSFLRDVTEINRVKIEEASTAFELKQSKDQLERVMGSLNESVWGVSLPEFKLNYVSESAVALYEMPLENWYANANLWSDVIHPDDKERVAKESEALFVTGQTNLEYKIITGSNKVKWIFSNTKVLKNEEGVPYLMTGIAGDITARKLAEQELFDKNFELKQSKDQLERVMSSLNESVWGVSLPEFKLNYVSESAVALYEMPLENWYANANLWSDVIHPDDKERVLKESEALFTVGYTNLEYKIITGSNKVKWIYSNTKVLKNEEGVPYLMTGIAGDITARKLAELELRYYKTAIDESAIVSITDVNGIITYVNDKFCEVSKYSQHELIGANHNIIKSNYHSNEFFKHMWQTISSGNIWKGEIKNKAKDGSEYYVESTIVPFMENGKPFRYIAIRYETTQLKLKEEVILNQKLFYENILNNLPIDIAVFDADHKYVFINKEAIKDDETRNWLIGKDDFDYAELKNLPHTFAKSRREIFNQLSISDTDYTWLEEQKKNNEIVFKERRFHFVKDEKLVIGYGLNVTDLKKHELLLAESVHEKETLLGEIHHRVKNNLAIIDGMVELKKSTEPDLHLKVTLSEIQSRIKTVALVHQKLYQSALFSNVNIGDYVLELIDYHRRILNKTASDQFKSNLGIKNIYTDISKAVTFGLIFNELLSNSFKYGVINNFLEISISMEIKEDKVYFIYTDSGKGLYADEKSNNKGFGLNLINTLSKQLKARINYPKENYFKIELDFSIKNIQVQIAE